MKKFFDLFILFITAIWLVSCGSAKSVGYTHRALATDGCHISYSVVNKDGLKILVSVRSDRLVFPENPEMKFKNFEGQVMELKGEALQTRSETGGVVMNNIVIPISEICAMAYFDVKPEDITFFESGIMKVMVSTLPIEHVRSFKKDKIGKYLHNELCKAYNIPF